MKLRFTSPAARQLDEILDHIASNNTDAVGTIQRRLRDVIAMLLQYPEAGALTSRPGMRRMVVTPYPYVIYYRAGTGDLVIHGVRHTARRPIMS